MEKRSPKSHMLKTSMSKGYVPRSPLPKSPLPKSPMPRSPELYEKYKSRCAYGLISFFQFRHGHSKKLISDNDSRSLNRHSLGRRYIKSRLDLHLDQCIDNGVDEKTSIVDSGYARVKIIKEENVSIEQQITKKTNTAKAEKVQSDSEILDGLSRNHRKATTTSRKLHRFPIYGCYDVSTVEQRDPTDQNLGDNDKSSELLESAVTADDQVHAKNERECNCHFENCTHSQQNEINLQVNMNEATEAFINQKLIDGNHQSKHFLDALNVLNSNKDLFIKLLQDPNSLLVKHIEDLRDSQEKQQQNESLSIAKLSELQMSNARECNLLGESGEKIVVFRSAPKGLQNCDDRINHETRIQYSLKNVHQSVKPAFFSLEQMKRKLMHALGGSRKERRLMLTNGHPHQKPNSDLEAFEQCGKGTGMSNIERNSTDKASSSGMIESSMDGKRKDNMDKVDEFDPIGGVEAAIASESSHENSHLSTAIYLKRNKHDVNTESEVHISELKNGTASFLRNQRTKTDDGISSVPEYDLLRAVSSRRTREPAEFLPQEMRFPPNSNHQMVSELNWRNPKEKKNMCSSPVRQSVEAPLRAVNRKQLQMHEERLTISENCFPDAREQKNISSADNDLSHIETNYSENSAASSPSPEVLSNLNSLQNYGVNQTTETVESCEDSGRLNSSRLNSSVENQTSTSSIDDYPSSPLNSQRFRVFDMINENAEQPSPVSVLDHFFTEVIDPLNTKSQPALPSLPLLQTDSEEGCLATCQSPCDLNINSSSTTEECGSTSMFKCISTVLQACHFNWDELARKYYFSDQLLDQSLLIDIDLQPNQSCGDYHKLLFDYVNEVLIDVCQCYLRCLPLLSFIKPRFIRAPNTTTRNIVDEAMKFVDWNLLSKPCSQTLDQLIEKDLTKSSGTWMNIRIDAEDAVNEMVDSILEELIIDIALE